MPAEPAVQQRRDRRQQVAHRVLHAADVRLRHGKPSAVSRRASSLCDSALAAFLLVELARLLDAQGPLDEAEPAAQLVLGQMPGQHHDFAALRPRAEQARDAEEAFVLGLAPQLAQDRQPRVAAVADDVVRLAGPARDRGRRVQPALADGRLDVLVGRVARHARVVVVGAQLVQRHHHRRVGDGVAQGRGRRAAALEAGGQQLGGHVLRRQVSHGRSPEMLQHPGPPAVGAAKLRTGVALGAVVARRRAGVDRRAALLREQQVPAAGAHHVPAFAQGELDQRAQPLVAAGQFMCARHGRPLPHRLGR
jgi:hypothetical protein